MPAIPDIPKVFFVPVLIYKGPSQEGRVDYESGLYIEETWLDGATLNAAVSLVDDGNLVQVYQVEPASGRVINAGTQVANAWFVRNGADYPADKSWPDFISNYCEFSLYREEAGERHYTSPEDQPH